MSVLSPGFPMGSYGNRWQSWDHLPRHKDTSLGFFPNKRSTIGFLPAEDPYRYSSPSNWHPYRTSHYYSKPYDNDIGFFPSKRADLGFLPAEAAHSYSRGFDGRPAFVKNAADSQIGFLPYKRSGFFPAEDDGGFNNYGWADLIRNLNQKDDKLGFLPATRSTGGFLPTENSYHSAAGIHGKILPPCHVTKTLWGFYCCELPYGADGCDCQGPNGAGFFC